MTMTIRPVSTIGFIGLSETNTIGYYIPGEKAYAEYKKFTGENIGLSHKPFNTEERDDPQDSAPDQTMMTSKPAQLVQYFYNALLTVLKKWTFDLSMPGVA